MNLQVAAKRQFNSDLIFIYLLSDKRYTHGIAYSLPNKRIMKQNTNKVCLYSLLVLIRTNLIVSI